MKMLKNYALPTPKNWRIAGDVALLMLPVIIAEIPKAPISEAAKYWVTLSASLLLLGFKFWTNTHVHGTKSIPQE